MIYSLRCTEIELTKKLKTLNFPQISLYFPEQYINDEGITLYINSDDGIIPKGFYYEPIYSEILDWLFDEHEINIYLVKKEQEWFYFVEDIEVSSLLFSGIESDENICLKTAIKKIIDRLLEIEE